MAISVLQQKTGTTASASSLSITPNSSITAGSLLIFETATGLNTRTVSGFTDANNTWAKLQSNAAQSRDIEIWYVLSATAGSYAVQVNISGANGAISANLIEFSGGGSTFTATDQVALNSGSSTSPTTGTTPTLTQADELAFGAMTKQTTTAVGSGPTNSYNALTAVTSNQHLSGAWLETSGTTGTSTGWTISSTGWVACIGTIIITPAASGGIPPTAIFRAKRLLNRKSRSSTTSSKLVIAHWLKASRYAGFPTGVPIGFKHKSRVVIRPTPKKLLIHRPNVRLFRRHGSSLIFRRRHKKIPLQNNLKIIIRNDKLLRLVQPPTAKLGIWIRVLRDRMKPLKTSQSYTYKKTKFDVRNANAPRPYLRHRRILQKPIIRKVPLVNKGIKPERFGQPAAPTGIIIRLVHRTRKIKGLPSKPTLRRSVFKLLRLVQPPASALGLWLKIIKHSRPIKTQTYKYKLGQILSDKLKNKIIIPSGIKIRIVKDPRRYSYTIPKIKGGTLLFKKLKNKIQPSGSALGIVLKIVKHSKGLKTQTIKIKLGALLSKKLRNKITLPSGIKIKLVKDPRSYKYTTPKVKLGTPLLQRIKRDIQPPAANLGIILRVVHRTRKVKAVAGRPTLRVFLMRLLRLSKPTVASAGVWMRLVKKSRPTRFLTPKTKLGTLLTRDLRNKIAGPTGFILRLVKHSRKQKYQIVQVKQGKLLFKKLKNKIQPPSAALGIWLRLVKKSRTLKTSAPRIKLGNSLWDKIKNKITPPAAGSGLIIRLVKKAKKQRYQFVKAKGGTLLTRDLRNKIAGPIGIVIRLIKDPRKQKYQTVKIKSGIPLFQRIKRAIQPPAASLAVLPRLIFKHRKIKLKFNPGLSRVNGLVRWKRGFSIPSGMAPYLFRQVRKTSITFSKAPKRVYMLKKLKGLTQPPSANLGILLRLIKDSKRPKYKTPQIKYTHKRFRFFVAPIAFILRHKKIKATKTQVKVHPVTNFANRIVINAGTKSIVYVPRRHKIVIKPVPKKVNRIHRLKSILFYRTAGTIDVFLTTSIALSATLNKSINSRLSTNINLAATLGKALNIFLSTSIRLVAFINIQPLIKKILHLIMPLLIRLDLVSPLTSQTVNLVMPLTPQQVNLIMPLTMTTFTLVMPLTPQTFTIIMPLLPE